MKMTLWILKVFLILGIFNQISLSESIKQDMGKVRCEASAVHMGGEGQIVCHYPTDLNKQTYEVNVVVEQFVNGSDWNILDCFWYDMHLCTDLREGYKMTSFTGNTLTVTINKVTDEHKGQYRCLLADRYTVYDFEFCDFVVKGSDEGGHSVEAVSAIVIGFLLSTVILVVCVVWRRRQRMAKWAKSVIYRTVLGKEQHTENGDVSTGVTTAENRNGSSYKPDLEDTNSLFKSAITSRNEGDQGRSEKKDLTVVEIVCQNPTERKGSDKHSRPVVHDHSPTASLERLGNQSTENGEMAENTVRQDVAFDADYTADKVAVSTPLLSSDQRPEVEPAMNEFDPPASQSSSLLKSPPQTSQHGVDESRYKQDLEANKGEEKWLLRPPGLSSNPWGGLAAIQV